MSVWVVLPSARPVAVVNARMNKWRAMGYKVALWRDEFYPRPECDLLRGGPYPGYAKAVNDLTAIVFDIDPACDWIVATGDDTDPDPTKRADEIARECSIHFIDASFERAAMGQARESLPAHLRLDMRKVEALVDSGKHRALPVSTFGVMQPTGDPWRDTMGRIIERIAGSPWLGREWCRRANKGQGPFWPEFTHMFGDEHLQRYAQSLGVFWQRPDLTHFHDHAQRDQVSPPAPHMAQWNTPQHWAQSKAIFERLVAGNFQECAPIP